MYIRHKNTNTFTINKKGKKIDWIEFNIHENSRSIFFDRIQYIHKFVIARSLIKRTSIINDCLDLSLDNIKA